MRNVAEYLLSRPEISLETTGFETRTEAGLIPRVMPPAAWPSLAELAEKADMPDLAARIRAMQAARKADLLNAMVAASHYAL